jgi:hypothetical protein
MALPQVLKPERLVRRLSGAPAPGAEPWEEVDPGHSRRGFLARVTMAATALSVGGLDYVLRPGSAYAQVCGPGTGCSSGWSVFCCTINGGRNECPPGSFIAGWWKADGSSFCGGAARYVLDCNATCPTSCSCYCPTGTCDNRRTCCNQFRYGQCHQEIACYGPVVCRVATCVPPWQYDPSCTTSSATDNRTLFHDAPCNPHHAVTPTFESGPAVGIQGDGRLEIFWRDSGGTLLHNWQVVANGGWSGFFPFEGTASGTPAVAANKDGRLEIFYVEPSGSIVHNWQTSPGLGAHWSGAHQLDSSSWPKGVGVTAGTNKDGRLEAFLVGSDGQAWHAWQTKPNNGWSAFAPLGGGPWKGNLSLGVNQDGRLEVFAIGGGGELIHNWQTKPNNGWSGWHSLGGRWATTTSPAVGQNPDGRLEIFVIGPDGQMWHNWQTAPNGGWSGFLPLGGGPFKGTPCVGRNKDGRLEVFCEEKTGGRLLHNWHTGVGGNWYGWVPL